MRWPWSKPKPEKKPQATARGLHQDNIVKLRKFQSAMLDRLTADFGISPIRIDSDINQNGVPLVVRARELTKNDDYARRFLQLTENNVIGADGIQLISEPKNKKGTTDRLAGDAIEQGFEAWGDPDTAEVTGQWAWVDIQEMCIRDLRRDGEAIFIMHKNWPGNRWRFTLQHIDSLQLDFSLNKKLSADIEIVMGVELNQYRKPIAYHFLKDQKSVVTGSQYGHGNHDRIPADRVIHIYKPEYAHQTRGVTHMQSSMRRLNQVSDWQHASLVAARVHAAQSAVMTRNPENIGYMGDDIKTEGSGDEEQRILEIEPGQILDLPYQATMHAFKPEHPGTTMPEGLKAWLRGAASGLGVSYNGLASDIEGVNFSSIRSAVLDDRDQWRKDQKFVARKLHQRVFRAWLRNALLLGQLRVTRPLNINHYEKYCECTWQGRGWKWVDPAKDQKSDQAHIDAKLKSPLKVMMEQGERPRKVLADLQRFDELLAEYGQTVKIEPVAALPAPDTTQGEDDDDDENQDD